MECPECGFHHIRQNGKIRGRQNHIWVDCGRQFIDVYTPPSGYTQRDSGLDFSETAKNACQQYLWFVLKSRVPSRAEYTQRQCQRYA
jgi:transposase-like protein